MDSLLIIYSPNIWSQVSKLVYLGALFFLLSIHDLNNVSMPSELVLLPDDADFFCPIKTLSSWQPRKIPKLINYSLGLRQTSFL